MGRIVDPLVVAMGLIEAAAAAGKPCPSNETIAHAIGAESSASGARMVAMLERVKAIRVTRYAMGREVEIVRTGQRTASATNRTPHWRLSGRQPKPGTRIPVEPPEDYRGAVPLDRMVDRDPCWQCGTRGDLGCRHRPASGTAPFEPIQRADGRAMPKPGNGRNFRLRAKGLR